MDGTTLSRIRAALEGLLTYLDKVSREETDGLKFRGNDLYAGNKRVIKVWESWRGYFWFAVAEVKPGLYYGLLKGREEKWTFFTEEEIRSSSDDCVVEVPKENWGFTVSGANWDSVTVLR